VSKISVPQGAEIESYIQRKAELRERLEEAKNVTSPPLKKPKRTGPGRR